MVATRLALFASCSLVFAPAASAQQWARDRGPGNLVSVRYEPVAAAPVGGAPRGLVFDADLTTWPFLWAFHHDSWEPPLDVPPLAPATSAVLVPALVAATKNRDDEFATTALWSLARLGRNDAGVAKDTARLLNGEWLVVDGRRGETALVAAGLLAGHDASAIATLVTVAGDPSADQRRREFAFYGLGLAAQNTAAARAQFQVLAAVERALLPESATPEIVAIAALHALALVRLDVAPALSAPASAALENAWNTSGGAEWIRSHVPLAAAAVLKPDDAVSAAWRERFVTVLDDPKCPQVVSRSCVLALAALCRPWDGASSPDAQCAARLRAVLQTSRDQHTRYFAWFAQGLVGGAENRSHLLTQLAGPAKGLERPWIALGLAAGAVRSGGAEPAVVKGVTDQLAAAQNPSFAAAFALAATLVRAPDVEPGITKLAVAHPHGADFAPAFAAALAMTTGDDALAPLRSLAARGTDHGVSTEAMRALALRGDGESIAAIRLWLADPKERLQRRIAAAVALRGFADEATVRALAAQLGDERTDAVLRAFAAFALGCLGDTSPRHWSAALARAIDYRSATPILLGLPNGVLRLP